jgi:hypothetical protein
VRSATARTWSGSSSGNAALLRLAGMVLLEQNDQWLVGRRYLSETSMALVRASPDGQSTGADPREGGQLTAS